jgi:LPXTG-site transpeptidase (sortase) family protein
MKNRAGYRLGLVAIIFLLAGVAVWQPSAVEAQTTSLPAQMNLSFSPISVPAGGISVLSVTIYNPNFFALTLSSLPAAWYVDFPSGLVFASTPNAQSTCGGVVSTSGTRLSLTGGTVPAKSGITNGECTVTVNVTSTIPTSYILTIPPNRLVSTDPTGTIAITNTTPASATLQVNTVQPPSVTKSFSSNTIWVGQTVTLSIRITNNDTNNSLTQVSLADTLPTNVYVYSTPSVSGTNCGSSFSVTGPGGNTLSGGETSFTINNATIAASTTCTISVKVTSVTAGSYLNTIPASSIHSQQGVTNASAASAPLNVQPIGLTKSFSPASFQAGGTSLLTITLQNPSSSDYTNAAFLDTLPAGVTLVSGSTSTTCANGSITEATGSISLSGATIPHGNTTTPGTCTVTGTVTSSIVGTYTNSIPAGALSASNNGQPVSNVIAGTANLTVYGVGGGLSTSSSNKSFSPSTIAVGGTSTLTINFTAPADTQLTSFTFMDALPTNVSVANPPSATKNANCGGSSTFSPAYGDTLLSFSGGTIPAGKTCTVTVKVTSNIPNPPGSAYVNTISPANISNDQNRSFSGTITASLTVTGLTVSKAFYPNIVNPGGISTLTITLTNTNSNQLDNVSLTDSSTGTGTTSWGNSTNGFMIAPTPNATTTCPGGTVNATAGAQSFTMTGGTIYAQVSGVAGLCTISVDVVGKGTSTTYTNTIPTSTSTNTWVSGTIHGTSTVVTNQAAATATIRILPLTINIVKGFDPLSVTGNASSTLTVQISNPNTVALPNISFTDSLPQGTGGGMHIANPANFSTGTCGGTLTGNPGDTSFKFKGGSLASGASCSLTLSVAMDVNANLTNTIDIGAVTSSNGASNTQAASASLTNLPGVNVSKAFAPNPIYAGTGNVSTLTITIQNTSNFQLDGLGMTDTFPTGVTVATTPASSQCGGTVTSAGNSITLAGGVLAGLNSCTVKVDLTAPAAGTYTNCIAAGALSTSGNIATNQDKACDTLTVNQLPQPPSIAKAFSPSTINEGGTSQLTFTVTNPTANTAPLTGVGFTDTLPSGVTIVGTPVVAQCNGTVSSTSNSITLTGGNVAANGSCTVQANVTSLTAGTYLNTSGAVTSANAGTGNTAQATLDVVVAPPAIAKAFNPSTINVGQTSTLTFTITNPNPTTTLTGVAFTDALPTGTWVADSPSVSLLGCNASSTPIFAPAKGDTNLSFSSGSITGGGTCTVSVDVTGNGGTYTNTSGAVSSTNGGAGNTASAGLQITGFGLLLTKSTTTTDFKAAGDAIDYSYVLTNTGTDPLYAPYSVTDNKVAVICPGEPASLNTDDTVTCTSTAPYTVISDDVTNGSVTNTATATAMDAATDGSPVTSNTSSVTVKLAALKLTKSNVTLGYRSAGDTIDYSYVLTNIGGVALYPPYAVSDTANGNAVTVTCPSTPASLAPGANVTCTATYPTTDADVTAGSVTNSATATAMDAASDGSTVNSNQASVTVNSWIQPPSIAKAFSPSTINEDGTSTLTFTITNPVENTIALTGVGFTDTLPTGVTVVTAPDANQCNGTVSSTSNSVTLTGGSIDANGSCTVSVTVTSAAAGTYVNTSMAVTSTNGGTGNTAHDTLLVVVAPPAIAKAFSPDTITVGQTSALVFMITNPNPTTTLTGVAFTDALPTGTWVANTPSVSLSGCNVSSTPVFAPVKGDTNLTFSNGSIIGGGTCTVQVSVTGNGGNYTNTSGTVTSTNGGTGNTANATLDIQGFGLSLVKSTTTRDFKVAGDTISYSYLLTNIGAAPLYAPYSVTDNKTTVSCPSSPASLNPGDNVTCTATYTVQSTDITAKSVTNTATATAMDAASSGNPVTSNTSSVTVKLAALKLTKNTSTSGYRSAGNTISYSYILTNIGSVALYPPYAVSDTANSHPVTVSCPSTPSMLNPAANVTCTATYTVLSSDVTNGSVTNTATATAQDAASSGSAVTSNQSSVTVYAVLPPQISKSFSPNTIGIGNTSLLTFTITNPSTNTVSLTGVTFSDTFPSGVTIASPPDANQCGGTVSGTTGGGSVSLSGGSIIPNGSCTVTVSVTSSTNGTKNNTSGSVSSTNGGTGNTASATLYVVAPPTITKSFSPDTILVGGTSTMTFTLTAPASNPVAVTGVSFTDVFPAGIQVVNPSASTVDLCGSSPSFSPFAGATSLAASNLDITPGTTCTITVPVTATSAGTFYNTTSTLTTANGGTGAESNTATLTANDAADLSITKSDGRLAFVRSQTVVYNIVVTNNGPSDATGASVIDTLPSSLTNATWTCAADTGASCTASGSGNIDDTSVNIPANKKVTYTVTAIVDSGATTDIVNKAVVLPPAGLNDSNLDNNAATDTDQLNMLAITKSVDPTVYATTGVTINYSYTVTNTGTSTLVAPFAVIDNKVTPTCSSVPSTLAPNDSFTCTAIYSTVQADLNAGSIVNSVYATGVGPDGDTVTSNTATQTTNATPDLYVTKSDGGVTATPGSHIIYTLKYRDVYHDATGVVLTETLPANTTFDSADSTSSWSCVSGTCTFNVGNLTVAAGEKQVTFAVTVNSYIPSGVTTIHNTVSIDDDHSLGSDVTPADNTATTDTPLTAQPSFAITKSDGQTTVTPGQRLTYTINYSNTGNQGATGVVLTETIPTYTTFNSGLSTTGWSCVASTCTLTVGALAAGSSGNSGSATFVVDIASTVPSGVTQIFNTVTIDDDHSNGTGVGGNNQQTATDTDTLNAKPTFTISKTDGQTTVVPGQRLTYTINYSNSGNQDATGVVLTETVPTNTTFNSGLSTTGWSCVSSTCTLAIGALAAGNSGSATFVVDIISIIPAGANNVVNTVSIDDDHSNGTGSGGNNKVTATDTDTLNAKPSFTITKDDSQTTVVPGQRLTYVINYSNVGDQGATGVKLTETVPTNTTFNSALSTTGWSCVASTCTLTIGALPAGSSNTGSATFVVDVKAAVTAGATQIVNTVSIDDDHANGTGTGGTNKVTATDTDNLTAQPAFTITKTDGQTTVTPGQRLTYTINYSNVGNQGATGVVLTETIPSYTTFNSGLSTTGWSCAGSTCTLAVGSLSAAAGSNTGTATFVVDVNATVPSGVTQTTNTVTIDDDHSNGTGTGGNNLQTATDTDTIDAHPAFTITKNDGQAVVTPGQRLTYTINYSNSGNQGATGVVLTETIPTNTAFNAGLSTTGWDCGAAPTCTLAVGALAAGSGNTGSATFVVDVNATVPSGVTQIFNTVSIDDDHSNGTGAGGTNKQTATDTDTLTAKPTFTITKDDGQTTVVPGQRLTYTINYSNTGNQGATGVVLTETIPTNTTFNSGASTTGWSCAASTCTLAVGALAAGSSNTGSATFVVDINATVPAGATQVFNTVSIDDDHSNGTGTGGNNQQTATDTDTLNAQPSFSISKDDGITTAVTGQRLTYTIDYSNVGNQGATGVVLTETVPDNTTFNSSASTSGWNCSAAPTCTFAVGSLSANSGSNSGSVTFVVDVHASVPAGVTQIFNTVSIDDDHTNGTGTGGNNIQTATDTDGLTAVPVFTITKDDGETTVTSGQTLIYTIDYSNVGDQGATGVVLTETLPDNTTFDAANSTSGWDCTAAPTCTFTVGGLSAGTGNTGSVNFAVKVNASIPAGITQIFNTVSIDDDHSNGTGPSGDNKQTATDTDTLTAKPTFTISKDDGVTTATPGQRLTYTIDYSNTGDQGATGVVLTETLPDNTTFNATKSTTGWDCSAVPTCTLAVGDLPAGSGNTGSVTFVVDVNNPVPSAVTQVFNTVSIDDDHSNGTGTGGNNLQTATDTDTLDAQPAFTINKSDGVTNAAPGDTLIYTINYGNTGDQSATGVTLTETLPDNTTFNSASSTVGWDCSSTPTCTLNVGDLPGGDTGATHNVAFAVNVNNPVPSGSTQIFNTVTIDDDHANGDFHQTATDTDTLDAQPAFVITKDDDVTLTATSQTLVYTIRFGNTGDQDATGVFLTETIPDNTTFNSSQSTAGWDCSAAPTCTLAVGDQAGGGSISSNSVTFAVDVNATIPAGVNEITNTVTIDDDHTNGDFHQTATDTDTLNAQPAFTITKDDGQTKVVTGQTLVYTIDYSNVGDQGATGVVLSETIPANTTFDAADSTTGWSCTTTTCIFTVGGLSAGTSNSGSATFAVTVNTTIPAGVTQIVNTVSIDDDHANGVGSGGDNKQTATDTDDITAQPAFTISKTDGITQVAAGSQTTYTITVTNNGDQGATGVVVKDTLDANVDFVSATPSGANYDSGTHTVTWAAVNLAAGATLSPAPTVTVKVNNPLTGDPEPTQIINNVQVDDDHSNGVNPGTGDNTATASDTDGISFPTKAIVGHDGPDITLPQVAIGEGLLYETTVQITPGTVTNLKLVDTLDHGLAFWKCDSIYGTGSATGLTEDPSHTFADLCSDATPTIEPSGSTDLTNAGRRIEFDFGTVSNTSTDVITLHIRYWAIVLDMAGNVRGTTLNNNAQWTWDGGTVSAQAGPVTVLEPTLTLTKTASKIVPSKGKVVTYTLTIDHAATSNENAYDVILSDVVPEHMAYVPGSLQFVSGQAPTTLDDSGAPTLQVKWDDFQLNPVTPTVRQTVIQFQATVLSINPGQTITNTANIEWRSMHNPEGLSVARSPWNLYSTERRFDPTDSALNNYRTTAQANIRAPELPNTGFAPGKLTPREAQVGRDAQSTGLSLEIPALKVNVPIVGIPYGMDGWDLTWLEKQAGYLEGTAYPTWTGNSVITGHVYNADGTAGIFVNLSTLKWGDQVIVHDGTGQEYIYEVRTVTRTTKDDLSPLQHEDNAWVTLLTCEGYDATTNQYTWRVAVSAVLVKVQPEQ